MVFMNFLLFAVAAIFMVKSGEWLVKSLTRISTLMNVKDFVVAFILMALSTTLPELFVGITSAMSGDPSLSLGNVIGSNIVNITLVMGAAAILGKGIKMDTPHLQKDFYYMLAIAALPVILLMDGQLTRIDGLILLSVFVFYVARQWLNISGHHKRPFSSTGVRIRATQFSRLLRHGALFAFALLVLFISARFVVKFAVLIAGELGVPTMLMGLIVVAIGTSLPELAFSIRAVLAKKGEMALGDILGAVIINSTLVIGITAFIHPVTTSLMLFLTSALFMMIMLFVFVTFALSGRRLSRNEGISLVLLYVFFLIVQFYLQAQTN